MPSIKPNTTIKEHQKFVNDVYGLSNNRDFDLWDMLSNIQRFVMRGLKGIRKNDKEKTKLNLLIALSWFMSISNQLHINIEDNVWKRFPYLCSYCGFCPCLCKEKKIKKRLKIKIKESKHPKTLADFQKMFNEIYPAKKRTLENAGIHLAEELGEFTESIFIYRGGHSNEGFKNIETETADFFSCILATFSSLEVDVAKELSKIFKNNCHICKKAPCECGFKYITTYKS